MSLVVQPKNSWATAEAWVAHRELISSLYWDQDKSLKEVQEIMVRDHGFHATVRMYKSRFKAWGLTKHLKTQEVEQICFEASRGKPLKPPSIRGRPLGSKKFKRYLDQVSMYTPGQVPPQPLYLAPSPLSGLLKSPDSLQFSEDCMHAVTHIARRGLETGSFHFTGVVYNWMGDIAITFWNLVNLVSDQLVEKHDLPEAFRLLHKCYDDFAVVLDRGDPSIIWTSIMAVLVLATVGYDLAASFVRYAAGLCAIKLGRHAPLTSLFNKIQAMGISQSRQAACSIISAYLDELKSDNLGGEEFRKVAYIHVIRALNRRGAMSFVAATSAYKKILKEFAACQDTQTNIDWYFWALQAYSNLLCDNGKFAEALAGLEEVGQHLHRTCEEFQFDIIIDLDPLTAMQYYNIKGRALEGLGRIEEATPYFVGAYELTRLTSKSHTFRLTKSAQVLEAHYRRKNDTEAAGRIRADFVANWHRLLGTRITWYSETPDCSSATHSQNPGDPRGLKAGQ